MPFPIEPLGPVHDRAAFACGNPQIDLFLHERVGQFVERGLTNAFVMVDPDRAGSLQVIAGFYTLSSHGLDYEEMPDPLRHKVPRRLRVGVTLLGYLGVDQYYQGRGLGTLLLYDALYRTVQASQHVATRAVIVDAIDDAAVRFYEHHQFTRFADDSRRLYRPLATIKAIFAQARPRSSMKQRDRRTALRSVTNARHGRWIWIEMLRVDLMAEIAARGIALAGTMRERC